MYTLIRRAAPFRSAGVREFFWLLIAFEVTMFILMAIFAPDWITNGIPR